MYTGQVVQDRSHSLEASNIPDIKLAFYKEVPQEVLFIQKLTLLQPIVLV